MNTLKSLFTAALLASVAITGTAQADNTLSSLIYEESANIYTDVSYKQSTTTGIRSYGDDHNQNSVWSAEFEQYVNPGDFTQTEVASIGDVNQYMGSNPTASGRMKGRETFIYNETAGEYHLQ
ncbi:MAG: hypothetical protein QNL62_09040 [Gammaproteobacteria bacterium]|nr:hypothetical protein [Gammaproteobacteria bacterium]